MRLRIFTAIALLAVSLDALAVSAFWTGQMHMVTTVTGQVAYNCQYNYAGQTFWRAFQGSCPASIEVQ